MNLKKEKSEQWIKSRSESENNAFLLKQIFFIKKEKVGFHPNKINLLKSFASFFLQLQTVRDLKEAAYTKQNKKLSTTHEQED